MDDLQARRDLGRKVIREMLGEQFAAAYEAGITGNGFCSDAGRMALEFAFAETWGQPGLDRKSRSMVILGALIALGKAPELRNHVRAALNNGITVPELEQIILQTLPYVGFVLGAEAMQVAGEVLKERGMDVKTSKDLGTL
ncbi:MAG: carboxymuconolactone decarboxylase family protein [Gammaproteobacteria bacterium]